MREELSASHRVAVKDLLRACAPELIIVLRFGEPMLDSSQPSRMIQVVGAMQGARCRTGNGEYCYPLTLADQHTRCLLVCWGLLSTQTVTTKPILERAFRTYGLPLYLANAMVDQHIGLEETDDGIWAIHFNTVLLATFDERDYIITG